MNNKKINISFILFITILSACNSIIKTANDMEKQKNNIKKDSDSLPIPKVTGIGGIFFFSDDPQKITNWYAENLGFEVDEYGSVFEFRNANRPNEINYLRWSAFNKSSDYFTPSKKEFMINYRVQNIDALIDKLEKNGVTVLDSITPYDYGKFVHILDPDGNKIALWEPIDSVLTQLGGKTTK